MRCLLAKTLVKQLSVYKVMDFCSNFGHFTMKLLYNNIYIGFSMCNLLNLEHSTKLNCNYRFCLSMAAYIRLRHFVHKIIADMILLNISKYN